MGGGDQSNESAIEQAKDEQISDFIRGQYKSTTGKEFPVKDKWALRAGPHHESLSIVFRQTWMMSVHAFTVLLVPNLTANASASGT